MITFISCLYVHQQTEIFRLAYLGQKKVARLEELLDKNSILRYNINKSASLVNISSKISAKDNSGFQMPKNYRLVRVASNNNEALGTNAQLAKKENIIARLFGVKRQAEARATNP